MDAKCRVDIENLWEVIMTNFSQARKLYSKGSRAQSIAWTNANGSSSRSNWYAPILTENTRLVQ